MVEHYIFGGDYNPEQWSEEVWNEDVRLMKEAGVNLVSLGIFSWAKLEPQPGIFQFDWLDQVMDLLHKNGVAVNLATPTASPPAWLSRLHPEILPVTKDGVTLWHGSRRHYCPHSHSYHEYATRIATKLAERYKDHPALVMWHVDNEYGCHFGECFCENSANAFRIWLQSRYGSLETLNFAWGTAFWGQYYGNWEEICPPRQAPAHINPTQQLDWARFCSDSWISAFDAQKKVLCQITPKVPVTTNFMGFLKCIDYWKFATHEDVVSNDCYPDISQANWMIQSALEYDLIRSIGNRRPWILMEQATSNVNWRQRNASKKPGIMRLGSYQATARGANGVMFFQWRQSKAGAEKFHSGMVPHAGVDTRIWQEVKSLGCELKKFDQLLASEVEAEVAILLDWENWWALELDSKPSNDLKFLPQLYAYYAALYKRNITVDFAHPEADLSRYKLVLAPNLYLVTDKSAENIKSYVKNGGTFLLGFFSGIVDQNEHVRLGGYPADFKEMLGLWVEDFIVCPPDQFNRVQTNDGKQFYSKDWVDEIKLNGATKLAAYVYDYYADTAAITENCFGAGQGFYTGTQLDENGIDWLVEFICNKADIQPVISNLPAGVEALRRTKGQSSWIFVLNHTDNCIQVSLDSPGQDLFSGEEVTNKFTIEPSGVSVIRQD